MIVQKEFLMAEAVAETGEVIDNVTLTRDLMQVTRDVLVARLALDQSGGLFLEPLEHTPTGLTLQTLINFYGEDKGVMVSAEELEVVQSIRIASDRFVQEVIALMGRRANYDNAVNRAYGVFDKLAGKTIVAKAVDSRSVGFDQDPLAGEPLYTHEVAGEFVNHDLLEGIIYIESEGSTRGLELWRTEVVDGESQVLRTAEIEVRNTP
jgi:hypothetical protein